MVTIDESLRRVMSANIVAAIEEVLFGGGYGNIRVDRVRQNVELATVALLGKEIKRNKVQAYCDAYTAAHVRAVVRTGEAVGIIAAQSLNQPVTQAVLKSQHRTGSKETAGANSLITLNKMTVGENDRTIKVHLRQDIKDIPPEKMLRVLTRKFEEVKLEDVLSSTYGNSKYEPETVSIPREYAWGDSSDYSQDPMFLYINHHLMHDNSVVYRFHIDPSKLDDAGLTQMAVYDVLLKVKHVMVVIHPPSTFTFDLVPGSKPLTAFLTMIKSLMSVPLKGIPGLLSISERRVEVSQLVRQRHWEPSTDPEYPLGKTYLYLSPVEMAHFPIEQLKSRTWTAKDHTIQAEPIEEVTRLQHKGTGEGAHSSSGDLFHLVYHGKPFVEDRPYSYFLFTGSLTMEQLLSHRTGEEDDNTLFSDYCDKRYLISNDPNEMIELVGKTGARTIHEYNYSEELTNGETPLLYQHITTVCRRMFGLHLNPITPISYMRSKEPNALDKFGYQNYQQNLEREIIKGALSTTNDLPSAVIVGKRPKLGTGYIELVVDNERRQEVIRQYSEARRAQLYLSEYSGIHFPKLGEVRPMTTLTSQPFGKDFRLPIKGIAGD